MFLFFSFSYAGHTFDKCTKYASESGRPYCLTTVYWTSSKYQIIYFIQNHAYLDCNFNHNNGINSCGPIAGAFFFVFSRPYIPSIKKSHSFTRLQPLSLLCVPGGDPVLRNSSPKPDRTKNNQNDCKTLTGETCSFPFM